MINIIVAVIIVFTDRSLGNRNIMTGKTASRVPVPVIKDEAPAESPSR